MVTPYREISDRLVVNMSFAERYPAGCISRQPLHKCAILEPNFWVSTWATALFAAQAVGSAIAMEVNSETPRPV